MYLGTGSNYREGGGLENGGVCEFFLHEKGGGQKRF